MIFRAGSMIARACSGSRSCWSSVEPLMSANRAVTVLRSPSGAVLSACSAPTPTHPGTTRAADDTTFETSRVPHFLQKLASEGFSVPQFAHHPTNEPPQLTQNLASWGLSRLQLGQRIVSSGQLVEQGL